ncbi:hypothetical protein [Elstera cyanobacteriorum]|uniref:hypothetical protein n=1 Tax=Elstera cyanobacteriorum TaxID=2022747 RepID=UPI0023525787|nr:hypothetical protein [Elstera cyanobacteriorum]MCK6442544.1 hypothetical protein [Elstera cyanobacteriorum]
MASERALAEYRRLPLLHWEKRDRGYFSPNQRTLSDAEDYLIWKNAQTIREAEARLKPREDWNEITALITISPVFGEIDKKLYDIKSYLLRKLDFRHWECFFEPSDLGRPHCSLYVLTHRRNLKDLHKKLDKIRKDEGRASVVHLIVTKETDWQRSSNQFPWPIGYFNKNALNKDRILSFISWVKGRRWHSRCATRELRERSLSPSGFIPDDYDQNLSIESTESTDDDSRLNKADPRYFNFQWSSERRITRLQDELEEHEGRLLNDQLCNLQYAKSIHPRFPNLIDSSGLPNSELDKKYIDLILKALESRDESILQIAQGSLESEKKQAEEKAQKPQREAEKRIKTVMAAYSTTLKAIRQKSKDKAVFAVANEIHNAVNSEDKNALSKFGLNRRNALIFDLNEVKIISQDIMQKIDEYDGESDTEQKKIMREINNKLRPHLHTLMYAELHISIDKFREKSKFLNGLSRQIADEILQRIDEKIGTHKKATCQGHWLKKALKKAMNGDLGRLREMIEEIDFRSDKTRAQHGRKPLENGIILVEDHSEVKARAKTKKIRDIELQKASEAAERAAHPRVPRPRQPRAKPAEKPA